MPFVTLDQLFRRAYDDLGLHSKIGGDAMRQLDVDARTALFFEIERLNLLQADLDDSGLNDAFQSQR